MTKIRKVLEVGDTGAEFISAFNDNDKKANIRIFNVEDYGAVHDGETDDTEGIQSAINAAHENGGGTVFVPNGIYLIAGPLKNNVVYDGNTVLYNSQLYIPPATTGDTDKVAIKIIGESRPRSTRDAAKGAVFKSTIEGTGVWPSVICSRSYNNGGSVFNYNDVILENISIKVNPHLETTGISMCGVNFIFSSHTQVKNVNVSFYQDAGFYETLDVLVKPENHAFGIGVGYNGNDFGVISGACVVSGFYYGYVLGEGIYCETLHSYNNYISVMPLNSDYGCVIGHLISNWCTNDVASQQETVYGAPGVSNMKIIMCTIEDWFDPNPESWVGSRGPDWLEKENYVLDNDDRLYGRMDYRVGGKSGCVAKNAGGTNFLLRNIASGSYYHWTTAGRPSNPTFGTMGVNTNTWRIEYYNSSAWRQLLSEEI